MSIDICVWFICECLSEYLARKDPRNSLCELLTLKSVEDKSGSWWEWDPKYTIYDYNWAEHERLEWFYMKQIKEGTKN